MTLTEHFRVTTASKNIFDIARVQYSEMDVDYKNQREGVFYSFLVLLLLFLLLLLFIK